MGLPEEEGRLTIPHKRLLRTSSSPYQSTQTALRTVYPSTSAPSTRPHNAINLFHTPNVHKDKGTYSKSEMHQVLRHLPHPASQETRTFRSTGGKEPIRLCIYGIKELPFPLRDGW